MNYVKRESCLGWILATTFSWICTSLLVAIMVIRNFPRMGWLFPAMGAGDLGHAGPLLGRLETAERRSGR